MLILLLLIYNMVIFMALAVEIIGQHEEHILNCNMPDTEDAVAYENQDEEAVAMIEESAADAGLNSNQHGTLLLYLVSLSLLLLIVLFCVLGIDCDSLLK